ncbi:MAG: ComF family protein [Eubacteriales bacterium]|nr:ComF family protein [Eubacteriales bacterium]
MKYFKYICNLLFPPHCIFCDEILDFRCDSNVCPTCLNKITRIDDTRCQLCFRKTFGNFGMETCSSCKNNKPHFSGLVSVYEYEKGVRDCILRLKFHHRFDHSQAMGDIMADILPKESSFDYIIAVPISRQRLFERGYNQSLLLAKSISKRTGIPIHKNLLVKTKNNKPQSSVERKDRALNVKGVYKVKDNHIIKGKSILLVDDVSTTRSTINECARMLMKAGAYRVDCVTFAVAKEE